MTIAAQLQARQKASVAGGVGTRGIFAEKAENAELWDVEGKRYIDFAAGIAVNNTGHRHPKVMQAVQEQAARFTHTCFHVAPYEGYVRLAERLNAIAPTGAENRTMLVTTGAEAVENAVKIARAYTKRSAIVAFSGAFHGRTMLGMALTGKVSPYKKNFGPFPAEIYHAIFPNTYMGVSVEDSIRALETLFAADVDPERVAAFIVEPVQGEGGFNVAPSEFLVRLREIADRYGILLIADEVQAGMARTGRMFGFEHAGVKPDIVTMAKGLAGGFPLSAVTGRAEVMNAAHTGGLGGTYAGNPLAVAAANAVLDVIEEEGLCERAAMVGERITSRLRAIADRQGMECIGDVRGLGAMVAFELVEDRASKAAAPDLTNRIVAEAEKRGLILLSCGTRANVVRILAPLTIGEETLAEGLDILEASIEAACSTMGAA
ncbi:4-aminobutyrate--2-oxoglutarate transaminase [Aquamicrobium sp. LC103]|uniref:4-aminobutyrate--2-oxoglutarate transaminase n=1 Tax=Aquamicrobium sp. LC103 TaxID=1120658 RepID=UPI00063EA28D|nr:4-aminobutyrate--2-oxoglutarate transaminase [Aquamicrobium sp. LC103]TKT69725.1 4-aminobutyrate--2-oxoglutarate transaminase [Aquamicrobium sp. LC103]